MSITYRCEQALLGENREHRDRPRACSPRFCSLCPISLTISVTAVPHALKSDVDVAIRQFSFGVGVAQGRVKDPAVEKCN
jgi:hypothetical protein